MTLEWLVVRQVVLWESLCSLLQYLDGHSVYAFSANCVNIWQRLKNTHEDNTVTEHKQETHAKMASGGTVREKLHNKLKNYVDPLGSESDSPGFLNVATGLIVSGDVNVDNSVKSGSEQIHDYETVEP